MNPQNPFGSDLSEAVFEARSAAREQLAAAWHMHLDRIREQLDAGWRESLDGIFAERFAEIEKRLETSFASAVQGSRRELTERLNSLARRIRQAASREEAIRTLLDGSSQFTPRCALFTVASGHLQHAGDPPAVIPLEEAPAFSNAVESRDTVVAAGTPGELSAQVTSLLGDASHLRVYLLPVLVRNKAVAVLYAEGNETPDVSALELLCSLAAPALEPPPESVPADIGTASAGPTVRPGWSDLGRDEQEIHLRAQRFARTRVAELVLHRIGAVRQGRAQRNLYGAFREEIDAARREFRREFFESSPTMVDYIHLELVRTLAQEDADALGPDYPGPLV